MTQPRFDPKVSEPFTRHYYVRLEGTGADDPEVELGAGVTAERSAEGHYLLTFAEGPGDFVGFTPGWQGSTPANLAGHTCVVDDYDSTNKQLHVWVYDGANAADDLDATEKLFLDLRFQTTVARG